LKEKGVAIFFEKENDNIVYLCSGKRVDLDE